MYTERRIVRVLERRGGRGDISFYVNVPKDYHTRLGKPSSYSIQLVGDLILLLPVRSIVVEREHSYTLRSLQEEFREYLEKADSKRISWTSVNEYLLRNSVVNGGVSEIIVFCKDTEYEGKAIVRYRNGVVEVIEGALSCGYRSILSDTTVMLIAYLSHHTSMEELGEVKRIVVDGELGAVRVCVDVSDNRVVVIPVVREN